MHACQQKNISRKSQYILNDKVTGKYLTDGGGVFGARQTVERRRKRRKRESST